MSTTSGISENQREAIEAAVYRRLVEHLRSKPEVQNIDLMNLADFCRNCLSKVVCGRSRRTRRDLGL